MTSVLLGLLATGTRKTYPAWTELLILHTHFYFQIGFFLTCIWIYQLHISVKPHVVCVLCEVVTQTCITLTADLRLKPYTCKNICLSSILTSNSLGNSCFLYSSLGNHINYLFGHDNLDAIEQIFEPEKGTCRQNIKNRPRNRGNRYRIT